MTVESTLLRGIPPLEENAVLICQLGRFWRLHTRDLVRSRVSTVLPAEILPADLCLCHLRRGGLQLKGALARAISRARRLILEERQRLPRSLAATQHLPRSVDICTPRRNCQQCPAYARYPACFACP